MTTHTAFQPTLMQKLLGRNYKWWYIVLYSLKQSNLKLSSFLVAQLAVILDFSITIFIWSLVSSSKETVTYFLIGFLLQRLVWTNFSMSFCSDIVSGKIINRLLLPSDFFKVTFFKEIGNRVIPNLISASLIIFLSPFYWYKLLLPNPSFVILLPMFLVFGFTVDFLFNFILGCWSFWNEDYRPLIFLTSILTKILSGLAIPFFYFPDVISNILKINFYTYLNYHPAQIYLGKYTTNEIIYVFLGGIAWCIILYFLAKLVFKLGLKRNESVGL